MASTGVAALPTLVGYFFCAPPCWTPWWVVRPWSEFYIINMDNGIEKNNEKVCKYKKFFIVKANESSFVSLSPFIIYKSVLSLLGEVPSIRKLRSGDLLIEVSSHNQSITLENCSSLGTLSVTVTPHKTLNSSRGVVSETELIQVSESEILENLIDQGVTNVRRITIRRDGKVVPTKHLILTFDSPSIPSHIRAGYLRCSVRPYIPNPFRCFKCQRFGHSKEACRGSLTCARCSEVGHETDSCSANFCCVNCKGNHPTYSRSCPKWASEKEIQTIKTVQKTSYLEARRIVESRTPTVGLSYAAVTATNRKSVISCGTQTNLTSAEFYKKKVHKPSIDPTFVIPAAVPSTSSNVPAVVSESPHNSYKNPPNTSSNTKQSSTKQSKPKKIDCLPSKEKESSLINKRFAALEDNPTVCDMEVQLHNTEVSETPFIKPLVSLAKSPRAKSLVTGKKFVNSLNKKQKKEIFKAKLNKACLLFKEQQSKKDELTLYTSDTDG